MTAGSCARTRSPSSQIVCRFPSPRQFQHSRLIVPGRAVIQPPPFHNLLPLHLGTPHVSSFDNSALYLHPMVVSEMENFLVHTLPALGVRFFSMFSLLSHKGFPLNIDHLGCQQGQEGKHAAARDHSNLICYDFFFLNNYRNCLIYNFKYKFLIFK